jgi:hypothetical protein
VIETQRASILAPHDHRHINQKSVPVNCASLAEFPIGADNDHLMLGGPHR